MGSLIIDGEVIYENTATDWAGGIVGFTEDNVLVLSRGTAIDAVSFGPLFNC